MTSVAITETPLVLFLLRRADDALVLGHRLSQWCGHAPTMEEDMAMANIGLDLIGQARSLYQYAAECEGATRDEDDLAYLRDAPQYRNALLVEQPNGDFARTMMRQFLYSAFADPWWRATMRSADATLAAIAAKSEKESAYHLRHASEWVIRLGDGTDESARRVAEARDDLLPFVGELFEVDAAERGLVDSGIAIDPTHVRADFDGSVAEIFARAKLGSGTSAWSQTGGRTGRHSEHLGSMLAEMQHLQRAYPGATW